MDSPRYPSSRRRMTFETSFHALGMSPESSSPRIEIVSEQKGLLLSALLTGQMLQRRAKSLMVVCMLPSLVRNLPLTLRTDGYGHLILRVEFAKRAT